MTPHELTALGNHLIDSVRAAWSRVRQANAEQQTRIDEALAQVNVWQQRALQAEAEVERLRGQGEQHGDHAQHTV